MIKEYVEECDFKQNRLAIWKWLKPHERHVDNLEKLEGFYMRLGSSHAGNKDILWFCYSPPPNVTAARAAKIAQGCNLNRTHYEVENEKDKLFQIFVEMEEKWKHYTPKAMISPEREDSKVGRMKETLI